MYNQNIFSGGMRKMDEPEGGGGALYYHNKKLFDFLFDLFDSI